MTNYCVFSGKLISEDEAWLLPSNRAFLYGDGIFETIYFNGSSAVYFEDHYNRLISGMRSFQLPVPDYFSVDYFKEQTDRLAKRNKIFRPARIRLQVFREADGFYTPENDFSAFLLQMKILPDNPRFLNTKGLKVSIYPLNQKKCDIWSAYESINAQLYVQAGIWARQEEYGDALILNTHGRLCETISSNLFLVKDNCCYTPPLTEGCIDGIMRKNLIRLMHQNAIEVREESLSPDDLEIADEVFTSNVIQGIKWIGAFEDQRYLSRISQQIADWIS